MAEEPGAIYFTGTAGAGKTSLVLAFNKWLQTAGYDAITVNLDPGNESTTFEPDIDIRDWVRLPEVMEEYGLGPNGAQVAAADLIALKIFEVKQALDEFRTDLVLIDTPGQVELFAFRESSKAIVDALSGDRSIVAFLFDPSLAKTAAGFVSLLLLSSNVEFRFRLPTVNLLAKSDLLVPEKLEEIVAWGGEPGRLSDAISAESATPEVQLSAELLRAVEAMAPFTSMIPTSATDGTGLEMLYRSVQRTFSGSEDLEPSHAPPES
ncbi:MAG TPA: ATP/GTP-binding protein [Thermoplasmata archaeon]|nr:ATP/GTP-binding protein [Thermoplasmata archaeon]